MMGVIWKSIKDFFSPEEQIEETEEMVKKDSKNYVVRVICKNCKNKSELLIPKGKVAKESIKSIACSKCDLKKFKMMVNQTEEDWTGDFFDDFSFEDCDIYEDDEKHIEKGKIELKLRINEEDLKEVEKFMTNLAKKSSSKKSNKKNSSDKI